MPVVTSLTVARLFVTDDRLLVDELHVYTVVIPRASHYLATERWILKLTER